MCSDRLSCDRQSISDIVGLAVGRIGRIPERRCTDCALGMRTTVQTAGAHKTPRSENYSQSNHDLRTEASPARPIWPQPSKAASAPLALRSSAHRGFAVARRAAHTYTMNGLPACSLRLARLYRPTPFLMIFLPNKTLVYIQ